MRSRARVRIVAILAAAGWLGCSQPPEPVVEHNWTVSESARELIADPALEGRIGLALDAAAGAGTDPSHSKYHVRAATTVEHDGATHTIVGGNSEWAGYPEAIHGETSLLNHAINVVGPEATRRDVDFLAFYTQGTCGTGGSCGDCRDYIMTTTRWQDLLMVCGQESDRTIHAHRFARWVVPETDFPEVTAEETGLSRNRFDALVAGALAARAGGVSLFTTAEEHMGVAALTTEGKIYRAAGADDAAFHYRYPVGAALQQAAAYRDYFVDAIAVATAPGHTPRVSYRDRQYGYESSSFNAKRGHDPIKLIVIEEASPEQSAEGVPWLRYRMTTFEEALPGAFSTASFMPDAVDEFLAERARP